MISPNSCLGLKGLYPARLGDRVINKATTGASAPVTCGKFMLLDPRVGLSVRPTNLTQGSWHDQGAGATVRLTDSWRRI